MMNVEWLKRMTDKDSGRSISAKPYTVDVGGVDWIVATNGHVLGMVMGSGFEAPAEKDRVGLLRVITRHDKHTETVSGDRIREWLETRQEPADGVPCTTCDGARQIIRLCDMDVEHEVKCPARSCATPYGYVGPAIIDRDILAPVEWPDSAVDIGWVGKKDFVGFSAPGWRVVVMPLLDSAVSGRIVPQLCKSWRADE